jgi:co-chaperonin GroES (HSP10)
MIVPILHRIIIKQDKLEEKDETFKRAKQAGIFFDLEEKNREQAAVDTGTVVKIGATAFLDFKVSESPITEGDYVVFAKHAGKTIVDPEDGQKYVALNDEDIICKLIGA